MPEPKGDAKSSGTESAATDLPHGTGASMENSCTSSPARMADRIPSTTASGDAEVGKDVTLGATIPDRSLHLSGDEEQRLARIRKDRANRFMVSVTDVDFLLEIVDRVNP
jgi:hypothetical protein